MVLDLTFVNAALTLTGNDAITEFDGSPGGQIAERNYANLVRSALSSYPWRWASKTATLNMIAGEVDEPWLYGYQLPGDLKHLSVVTVNGAPIDYEVQGSVLLCNIDTGADVIAKYIWAVPEGSWPPEFGEYITMRLEAMFLRGIGERFREAEARESAAQRKLAECRNIDSKRRTSRNPMTSPTLAARGAAGEAAGSVLTARTG
jgi:hypothetical protein